MGHGQISISCSSLEITNIFNPFWKILLFGMWNWFEERYFRKEKLFIFLNIEPYDKWSQCEGDLVIRFWFLCRDDALFGKNLNVWSWMLFGFWLINICLKCFEHPEDEVDLVVG